MALIDDYEFMGRVLSRGERIEVLRGVIRDSPKSVERNDAHLGDIKMLLEELDSALGQ